LAAASRLTGLPIATLSKVENGKRSLTYDKLLKVSKGFGVDIARLFSDHMLEEPSAMAAGRRSVSRGNDGFVIEAGVYTYVYLAQELVKKRFTPVLVDIHARSLDEFEKLVRHEGDELAFVIEGEVAVHSEIYEPLLLRQGESVYFDSGNAHAYLNAGAGKARILCIASTAEPPPKRGDYPTAKRAMATVSAGAQRIPGPRGAGSAARAKSGKARR
jgi:transcriptional regulator with XRE-family HTH domain